MENYNLIGELHDAAMENEWRFASGDDFYQNLELLQGEMLPNQLALTTTSFTVRPTIKNGKVIEIRYEGIILLGRKTDIDGEESSLDETYLQKYNRRLFELLNLLSAFVGNFACVNELEIESFTMDSQLNRFDTNIDFVGGQIVLIQ